MQSYLLTVFLFQKYLITSKKCTDISIDLNSLELIGQYLKNVQSKAQYVFNKIVEEKLICSCPVLSFTYNKIPKKFTDVYTDLSSLDFIKHYIENVLSKVG